MIQITPLRAFFALLAILLCTAIASAQDIKKVHGDYTFYGEGNHSLEYCKRMALEGARVAALKAEYGTTISNDVFSRESTEGNDYFSSLSSTEVKGEWIADDGEPKYEINLDDKGHYIVKCTISGRAKALGNEAVAFEAVTLRGSDDITARTTSFVNGDDLRLYFRAPVDGHVAVFLADDTRNVWRLLPYSGDGKGEVRTKHGKEYVFFSANRPDGVDNASIVDELVLTTDKEVERDEIYVVFSPKAFSTPGIQSDPSLPPSLTLDAFNKWMTDSRRRDAKMGVRKIGIEITNQ